MKLVLILGLAMYAMADDKTPVQKATPVIGDDLQFEVLSLEAEGLSIDSDRKDLDKRQADLQSQYAAVSEKLTKACGEGFSFRPSPAVAGHRFGKFTCVAAPKVEPAKAR
jgi:hypothetical protein